MAKNHSTKNEFDRFQSADSITPPQRISRQLREKIHQLTQPSPWGVFAKVLGVHTIVGTLTLLVCPQFGIGLEKEESAVYSLFLDLGHIGCMTACGAFFVGTGVLATTSLLNLDEARVFRKNSFLYLVALSLLSLVVFFGVGGEIFFGVGVAWLIGSLVGGKLSLETIYFLRFNFGT